MAITLLIVVSCTLTILRYCNTETRFPYDNQNDNHIVQLILPNKTIDCEWWIVETYHKK